jgi:phenolic acid decarboxylase
MQSTIVQIDREAVRKNETALHHFVRSQVVGGVQDDEKVGIQLFVSTDTLYMVGSWYDPTTCKVSASRTANNPLGKTITAFGHVRRSKGM